MMRVVFILRLVKATLIAFKEKVIIFFSKAFNPNNTSDSTYPTVDPTYYPIIRFSLKRKLESSRYFCHIIYYMIYIIFVLYLMMLNVLPLFVTLDCLMKTLQH